MSGVRFPDGFQLEPLRREHPRKQFRCGEGAVEDWLAAKTLQNQEKHLSATKVLLDPAGAIAGFYTLATGQVEFGDLPAEMTKRLPAPPVARRGAGVVGSVHRASGAWSGTPAARPGAARLFPGRQDVRVPRRYPRLPQRLREGVLSAMGFCGIARTPRSAISQYCETRSHDGKRLTARW